MDDEIGEKVLQQVMKLWVLPEIERRKKDRRLRKDFILRKIQIIFSHNRSHPKIRLNNEIKAIGEAKLNRPIEAKEAFYEKDVQEIKNIRLAEDDPNCAHITLLLIKDKWHIFSDFRYNRKRVRECLEAAKEFLESSRENLEKNRLRPFYENLFACAELLTGALLIQFFKESTLKGHDIRSSALKNWAKLGNIKKEFSDKLSKLWWLRDSARYMSSTLFKQEDPQEYLKSLDEMYAHVEESIS